MPQVKVQLTYAVVKERMLSDKSSVYDVSIVRDAETLATLNAESERAAYKIADAINEHVVGVL